MTNLIIRTSLTLTLIFAMSSSADAQSLSTESQLLSQEPIQKRSPTAAALLTTGTYLGGLGLLLYGNNDTLLRNVGQAGMYIAPTMGHAYAGETVKGLGLSLGSVVGGRLFASNFHLCEECTEKQDRNNTIASIGLGLHLLSTAYAIYDAGHAARRTNAKRSQFVLSPTVTDDGFGINAIGTF